MIVLWWSGLLSIVSNSIACWFNFKRIFYLLYYVTVCDFTTSDYSISYDDFLNPWTCFWRSSLIVRYLMSENYGILVGKMILVNDNDHFYTGPFLCYVYFFSFESWWQFFFFLLFQFNDRGSERSNLKLSTSW